MDQRKCAEIKLDELIKEIYIIYFVLEVRITFMEHVIVEKNPAVNRELIVRKFSRDFDQNS